MKGAIPCRKKCKIAVTDMMCCCPGKLYRFYCPFDGMRFIDRFSPFIARYDFSGFTQAAPEVSAFEGTYGRSKGRLRRRRRAIGLGRAGHILGALGHEISEGLSVLAGQPGQFEHLFQYPQEVRRLIYTTNAIEGFNRQLRKVTKLKSAFPTDDSLLKMLYLAMDDITKK